MFTSLYKNKELTHMAKALYEEERQLKRLDGWFRIKEIEATAEQTYAAFSIEERKAYLLQEVLQKIPLTLSKNAIFVGTQRDAFARSYALINPAFQIETFSGYCDPAAVYNDITPNEEFSSERIENMRSFTKKTPMFHKLSQVYAQASVYTDEVLFFVEQVTGHVIPDFRFVLRFGIDRLMQEVSTKDSTFYRAALITLNALKLLITRYLDLIRDEQKTSSDTDLQKYQIMEQVLIQIYGGPARNLTEALQLYILLWQVMCIEQAPNPYAFSVGNADRIFEPYRCNLTREEASELFKHFLVFFNVGDRSWAISQNVLIGGRDIDGHDLTNPMTYAILDAYYDMNLPQPILSVKLHHQTPDALYQALGRFFFSPGVLTPSLFNDDALFSVLEANGVDAEDLADYAIAGCQEPLIMGKDNGNTTNSWLNLAKILEIVLAGGVSAISGKKIMALSPCCLSDIRNVYYETLEKIIDIMCESANRASLALSELRVPFLSIFMGGLEYDADMRDPHVQGTKYNGSGCLIHGLSVLADSFVAIDCYIHQYPNDELHLIDALRANFEGHNELRNFLLSCPKFGNHIEMVDKEAHDIAVKVSQMLRSHKNYLGNPFRPDFSTPSTHLLYGYWVGTTPDGRKARNMLGYGVDPLYGTASGGLGFRLLSNMELPFAEFNGGYASHFGIDPKYFKGNTLEEKGMEFKRNVVYPLFFNDLQEGISPFYLYVNVTTADTLRKVLANPETYAPNGVYIVRIHGTFVNFLDLSPSIQNDIIARLDPDSTAM